MTAEPPEATREAFESDTFPWPENGFICFHCGETFTHNIGINAARHHFGSPSAKPACVLKGERALVVHIRDLEAALEASRVILAERDALICNLTDALKKVRPLIEDELDVRLDSFTTGNDRATLLDGDAQLVDECDNALRIIDAALSAASGEK